MTRREGEEKATTTNIKRVCNDNEHKEAGGTVRNLGGEELTFDYIPTVLPMKYLAALQASIRYCCGG